MLRFNILYVNLYKNNKLYYCNVYYNLFKFLSCIYDPLIKYYCKSVSILNYLLALNTQ